MTTDLDKHKSMTGFTEDDVRRTLRRALILAGALALIATPILWVWLGWQTWLMFLVGAVISATGIFEWMQMLSAMMSRMEEGRTPTPMGRVMVMFFLRLALAGLLLYASLNSLHGSIYALLAGLAVSLLALSVESIRLVMRT
jgi:Na+/H+-translocating membrane pyrophosphatase